MAIVENPSFLILSLKLMMFTLKQLAIIWAFISQEPQ